MPNITFIQPDGTEKVVEAAAGTTLMEVAIRNDVEGVLADCGGALSCATCHVYVRDPWVDEVGTRSEMEESMLEMAISPVDERRSRLSCQITLTDALDGLTVDVPENE